MIKLIKKLAMRSSQSGEIILVILLVMTVGLTIGLSIAGRSLTDVRLSTQIDESSRAFSAAEAGIENVLSGGLFAASSKQGTIGDANYNVSVVRLGGDNNIFTFPTAIEDGDGQTIWLVPHDANGPIDTSRYYTANSIEVCWGDNGAGTPALEVAILFKSESKYKVARAAYDPESSRSGNNFTIVSSTESCSQQGSTYKYHKNITFTDLNPAPDLENDILIALRVKPVYASAKIAVVPANEASLPEQGKNISSVGKTGSGVTRRWNVVQTYSAPTDFFDYAVWSYDDLIKVN